MFNISSLTQYVQLTYYATLELRFKELHMLFTKSKVLHNQYNLLSVSSTFPKIYVREKKARCKFTKSRFCIILVNNITYFPSLCFVLYLNENIYVHTMKQSKWEISAKTVCEMYLIKNLYTFIRIRNPHLFLIFKKKQLRCGFYQRASFIQTASLSIDEMRFYDHELNKIIN